MNLEQLILDCQKKNIKAQEQLFRLFSSKLFAVCLKYSRNYEEAQDNLQDGFMLIFDKIGQFAFAGSFEGWAKRLMINNALQVYRKDHSLRLITEDVADEEVVEIDDNNLSMDYLLGLIQELPDRYRLVFNLYVIDNYAHKEISEMLGISIGTSKSNLSRARTILKDKIEALQTTTAISAK
ncbi:RNA polymerase sigma factor [Flavobacterium caeni]|uniref:RNA polymerase sigma-70 factor, ECF subfamily n=1 Tax=Flavobacterium caeni TaxID=490189 RepID=A0A1G5DU22_9FLAO|nr:sigma-70 family RNA polymerase sigma factor [Flavobacterium caeni]SCY18222.1 RNA polymerase sigma-70 factor, ECF subfamily [Flavobacterium caeni]